MLCTPRLVKALSGTRVSSISARYDYSVAAGFTGDAAAYGDLLTPDLLTRGGGGLVGAPVGGSEEEEPQWACWTWGAGFEPTSAALWWNRRPADQERLGVGEIRQPFVYALPQRVLGVDAAQEPATQLKSRCRV